MGSPFGSRAASLWRHADDKRWSAHQICCTQRGATPRGPDFVHASLRRIDLQARSGGARSRGAAESVQVLAWSGKQPADTLTVPPPGPTTNTTARTSPTMPPTALRGCRDTPPDRLTRAGENREPQSASSKERFGRNHPHPPRSPHPLPRRTAESNRQPPKLLQSRGQSRSFSHRLQTLCRSRTSRRQRPPGLRDVATCRNLREAPGDATRPTVTGECAAFADAGRTCS